MESIHPGTNFGFYSQVFKLFKFEEPTMDLVWDLNELYETHDPYRAKPYTAQPWSQLMNGLAK